MGRARARDPRVRAARGARWRARTGSTRSARSSAEAPAGTLFALEHAPDQAQSVRGMLEDAVDAPRPRRPRARHLRRVADLCRRSRDDERSRSASGRAGSCSSRPTRSTGSRSIRATRRRSSACTRSRAGRARRSPRSCTSSLTPFRTCRTRARKLLPGPVTVILADGRGIRVPDQPLLADVAIPVLQTSANPSGGPDPRRLEDVDPAHPRGRRPRNRRGRAARERPRPSWT